MELLEKLCTTPGIPGREQAIIDLMTAEFKKSTKNVTVDAMGNVIAVKKSKKKNAPKIMIAGHMDEIGFIVSHIDEKGFVHFAPRGGHMPRVLVSQRVKIFGKKEVVGVVEGSSPFMDRANAEKVDMKQLYIDTGISATKLKKMIQVGDMIVLDREFVAQGDVYISKAFDDRIGCYIALEVMKKIKNKDLSVDVYAVGTTQEEVGIRGAFQASKDIAPSMGVAFDITGALDTPGVPPHLQVTKLGEGVAIKINDMSTISNHGIVEHMKKICIKNKIKHQLEVLPFGGTDAMAMQRFGEGPVCTLSIPTRYGHSPNEMIHKKDVDAAIKLAVKFLEEAHRVQLQF